MSLGLTCVSNLLPSVVLRICLVIQARQLRVNRMRNQNTFRRGEGYAFSGDKWSTPSMAAKILGLLVEGL